MKRVRVRVVGVMIREVSKAQIMKGFTGQNIFRFNFRTIKENKRNTCKLAS